MALGLLEGREQCVEFDPDHSVAMFYRNKLCRNGRAEYEEFQEHSPLPWVPKCMIVLLDATSRADLRDKLLEGGRSLVSPLRVTVNYTTTLSEDPDLELASVNCVLGRELKTLYDYDRVGQEKTDEPQAHLQTHGGKTQLSTLIMIGMGGVNTGLKTRTHSNDTRTTPRWQPFCAPPRR